MSLLFSLAFLGMDVADFIAINFYETPGLIPSSWQFTVMVTFIARPSHMVFVTYSASVQRPQRTWCILSSIHRDTLEKGSCLFVTPCPSCPRRRPGCRFCFPPNILSVPFVVSFSCLSSRVECVCFPSPPPLTPPAFPPAAHHNLNDLGIPLSFPVLVSLLDSLVIPCNHWMLFDICQLGHVISFYFFLIGFIYVTESRYEHAMSLGMLCFGKFKIHTSYQCLYNRFIPQCDKPS